MLYTHIHADVIRNIITNFKERTITLLYKNIPHTLYSREGCERVACERGVADGDRMLYNDPKFFS